jgi:branched-chain amino acid aminotransferase
MLKSLTFIPEPAPVAAEERYLLDGELVPASTLPHPLLNRAFSFADGFFESIRVVGGVPRNVELHYGRIVDSCAGHRMELPDDFTRERFSAALQDLAQASGIREGGYIRVTCYRSGGGRYLPLQHRMTWVGIAKPLEDNHFVLNERGLKVDIYTDMRKPLSPLANFKNLAATLYVQSAVWAEAGGFDEALILNDQHQIIESTRSNIFLASNGVLYTPGLECGPVGGVMRAAVIGVAQAAGMKVYECNLSPQELLRADELFLTNALRGIQWVSSYRTKRYFSTTAQQLTHLLNERFTPTS